MGVWSFSPSKVGSEGEPEPRGSPNGENSGDKIRGAIALERG